MEMQARFCLMDFEYFKFHDFVGKSSRNPVKIGICMPDACSPQLFEAMFNEMTNKNESFFKIPYKTCQIKDDYSTFTSTDYIAM